MAITTLQGIADGLRPEWLSIAKDALTPEAEAIFMSMFYLAGAPTAGAAPSAGLNGEVLSAPLTGAFPWKNPVSGNSYLAGGSWANRGNSGIEPQGSLFILDRLWQNSGFTITTTTEQTLASVAWPSRDKTGTTNGADIFVSIEVSAATGNAGAITNTTLNYTNSAGTTGRTGTMASFPATAVVGTFVPFELQAGDVGIRSIQGLTLGTSYVSGTIHLVAYRMIAIIPMIGPARTSFREDAVGLALPRLYDNTCLFLVYLPVGTAAPTTHGQLRIAQG
jgi:hypothetical protein